MKLKLATAFLAATVLISCKKDEKATPEAAQIQNPNFTVEFEGSAQKTDNFAVYFTEDGTNEFKDVNAVWSGINGGKTSTIVFTLPETVVPTHIRLDLGLKQDQDSVVVKRIKVNFNDNAFEFKGSEFFNYFIKNEQFATTIDQAAGTMTVVKKDGVYKTPYYYPTGAMIDNIKKITSVTK